MSDQSEILENINKHILEMITAAPPVVIQSKVKGVLHPSMERLNKSLVAKSVVYNLINTLYSKNIITESSKISLHLKIMELLEEEIMRSCGS